MFKNPLSNIKIIYRKESFIPNKKYITDVYEDFTGNIEYYRIDSILDTFVFERDIELSIESVFNVVVENKLFNKLSEEGLNKYNDYVKSIPPVIKNHLSK